MPNNTNNGIESPFKIESISENEMRIIQELRTLRPFEKIEIMADKMGKIDNYFITRTFKIILN